MKKNHESNNKGLSLVELLVAVVIIAIVALPLLHSFVTAANLSSKSRSYGDATIAAQNIQEAARANSVVAFSQGAAAAESLLGCDIYPVSATDTACVIDNLRSGSSVFDARVTFSAGLEDVSASDSAFYEINSVGMTQYTDMDYVYTQPYLENNNPDQLAMSALTNYTSGEYRNLSSRREIFVRIGREDTNRVRVYVQYLYHFSYSIPLYDANGLPTSTYIPASYTYENTSTNPRGFVLKEDGSPMSVYLMYYPTYGSFADVIYIEGLDDESSPALHQPLDEDIPLNVFIIKQHPIVTDADGAYHPVDEVTLHNLETGYNVEIHQYERYGHTSSAKLYTNSGYNLAPVMANEKCHLTYKVYNGPNWADNLSSSVTDEISSKSSSDRLYAVTIELFDSSAFSADELEYEGVPIYTFEGSKLK